MVIARAMPRRAVQRRVTVLRAFLDIPVATEAPASLAAPVNPAAGIFSPNSPSSRVPFDIFFAESVVSRRGRGNSRRKFVSPLPLTRQRAQRLSYGSQTRTAQTEHSTWCRGTGKYAKKQEVKVWWETQDAKIGKKQILGNLVVAGRSWTEFAKYLSRRWVRWNV